MPAATAEDRPATGGARDLIRDAATIILLRRSGDMPEVLMGQRGAAAAFMPDKFVFPGGAVDPADFGLGWGAPRDAATIARLGHGTDPQIAAALPYAAVRELWEETGIILGRAGEMQDAAALPACWQEFAAAGRIPDVRALEFVFRAVTPPGRPRRFDARFFLLDADAAGISRGDLARGDGELAHLQWLAIPVARRLALPFITEVVLAELDARLAAPGAQGPVPFFQQGADGAFIHLL